MGKWKGTAPLSSRGDWAHGPLLQLKFNPHKSKAKIGEDVVKRVGKAYDYAINMLDIAIKKSGEARSGKFTDIDDAGSPVVKALFEKYFGNSPDFDTISKTTLEATSLGLRSTDKSDRVYLFDGKSKPDLKKEDSRTVGYVARYPVDRKKKQHRPIVGDQRRGHIHINYTVEDTLDMASTIVHEATHRFAGTGDFAYAYEEKFGGLTAVERLNNADSYAACCREIYLKVGL